VQAQSADLAGYSDKDQSTLFLLSVFVGTLGLDRFYLGQTGLGIAKLLTCGGFGIWAMVDMIMAGAGALRDAQGRMLRPAAMVGSPTKSQGTAFLLAYFGGTLGLDRFYLGQTGLGVAKLLTCGGLGIWALIDLVLIGLGKLRDAQGNSLRPGF
jgi:TM2 domain-containing membrane protein YozV